MKLLIVDDDPKIVESITFALKIGIPEARVISVFRCQDGLRMVEDEKPDLVLLDLGLPDADGCELLRDTRLFSDVPIIVLTVRSEEAEVVKALELGANEYVVKPFRQMELLARVRGLLKRPIGIDRQMLLNWGSLRLDMAKHRLTVGEKTVILTQIEAQILRELIRNVPNLVSYARFSEIMIGDFYLENKASLKVHIYHLRQKINSPDKEIILNKRGEGYCLAP